MYHRLREIERDRESRVRLKVDKRGRDRRVWERTSEGLKTGMEKESEKTEIELVEERKEQQTEEVKCMQLLREGRTSSRVGLEVGGGDERVQEVKATKEKHVHWSEEKRRRRDECCLIMLTWSSNPRRPRETTHRPSPKTGSLSGALA